MEVGFSVRLIHRRVVDIRLARYGALEKTDAGYRLSVAKYDPASTQVFTWASRDLGPAAVALLTSYADPSKGVLGKSYPVVSFRITHPEFAAAIAKGTFLCYVALCLQRASSRG